VDEAPVLPSRAAVATGSAPAATLDDDEAPFAPAPVLNLRELERITIERALVTTGGHRTRAAELLGISERTLRNKLNGGPREEAA
jgi:DNA-binding NtrC family response regulator